eukprot:TRINITY_DN18583_c2_g1_i1.p1 TRINITY_DN18583_c2_g1~~TRINITY_DN18583_c2_g1_i1.p1  ORF type:complete len:1316 (+),score=237.81 TRINITY_DN18583_c2_g1_i1:85-3948(+)
MAQPQPPLRRPSRSSFRAPPGTAPTQSLAPPSGLGPRRVSLFCEEADSGLVTSRDDDLPAKRGAATVEIVPLTPLQVPAKVDFGVRRASELSLGRKGSQESLGRKGSGSGKSWMGDRQDSFAAPTTVFDIDEENPPETTELVSLFKTSNPLRVQRVPPRMKSVATAATVTMPRGSKALTPAEVPLAIGVTAPRSARVDDPGTCTPCADMALGLNLGDDLFQIARGHSRRVAKNKPSGDAALGNMPPSLAAASKGPGRRPSTAGPQARRASHAGPPQPAPKRPGERRKSVTPSVDRADLFGGGGGGGGAFVAPRPPAARRPSHDSRAPSRRTTRRESQMGFQWTETMFKLLLKPVKEDTVLRKQLQQVFTAAIGGSVTEKISMARFRTFARDARMIAPESGERPVIVIDKVSLELLYTKLCKSGGGSMGFDRFMIGLLHMADYFFEEEFASSPRGALQRLHEIKLRPYAEQTLRPEDDPENTWSVDDESVDLFLYQYEDVIRRIFRSFVSQDLRDEPTVGGIAPGHPQYYAIGANWRELMRYEDFVRFARWARFYPHSLTAFQVAKILKASNHMYPNHPMKQGIDDVALLEPEFRDALVRVAVCIFSSGQWANDSRFADGEKGRLQRVDALFSTYLEDVYPKLAGHPLVDDLDFNLPRHPEVRRIDPQWGSERGGVDVTVTGRSFCVKRGVLGSFGSDVVRCHVLEPNRVVFRVPPLNTERWPLDTYLVETFKVPGSTAMQIVAKQSRAVPVRISNDRRVFVKPPAPYNLFTYERMLGMIDMPPELVASMREVYNAYTKYQEPMATSMSRAKWYIFAADYKVQLTANVIRAGSPGYVATADGHGRQASAVLSDDARQSPGRLSVPSPEGRSNSYCSSRSPGPPVQPASGDAWNSPSLSRDQLVLLESQQALGRAQELFQRAARVQRQTGGVQEAKMSFSDFVTALVLFALDRGSIGPSDLEDVIPIIEDTLASGTSSLAESAKQVVLPQPPPDPAAELRELLNCSATRRHRSVRVMRGPVLVGCISETVPVRDRCAVRDADTALPDCGSVRVFAESPPHLASEVMEHATVSVSFEYLCQRLLGAGYLLAPPPPEGPARAMFHWRGDVVGVRPTCRHSSRRGILGPNAMGQVTEVGPNGQRLRVRALSGGGALAAHADGDDWYDSRDLVRVTASTDSLKIRRCWVVRRRGRLLGGLWSCPGQLSTLSWMPAECELNHPEMSAMLHGCSGPADVDLLQFYAAWRGADDAAGLLAALAPLGYTFSPLSGLGQAEDYRALPLAPVAAQPEAP